MIKIQSIVDNTRKYLEDCIFRGDFCPGQQIKEQEIASLLGISRPPVREAMKLLEGAGLITRKPNRGAFVTMIDEKDAWEIYTLKSDLYEFATRLAFEKISDDEIRGLEKVVKDMETCIMADSPDVIRYQELNQRFHDMIIQVSGHQRLRKIVQILHHQVMRFSCMSLMNEVHLKDSLHYHRKILAAFKKRDMAATIELTHEHIMRGLDMVQEIIAKELSTMKSTGTETE